VDDAGAPVLAAVAALGWDEVGRSTEARPIYGRRFGGPGRPLLLFGGIHGDEPSSVEAVLDLARVLDSHAPAGPLWLVPAANPDGLAANRKNSATDVDLNRNFPARSFTPAGRPGYCPGPAPLSEPETQAIARLLRGERVRAAAAVHAPFGCVNHDGPAAAWAAAVAAACGWPARADIGYPTPGSFGSWAGVDLGLPVLTLELPPGPLAGFRAKAAAALAIVARGPGQVREIE
jgi:murein peptide amidase A